MDGKSVPLAGLSGMLHSQFTDWLDRRKPQEEKMLRSYQDMMRISRDDDTKDGGTSKAQKSKVFIGSTRSKIRSARAKIKDSLFGAGKMPFDTTPSNEDLKDFSDTMEKILTYQLNDPVPHVGTWKKVVGTGIDSISTYGTGFIFGPFVNKKKHTVIQPNGHQLQEVNYEYDCPYYEHARSMDVYPDPEAEDVRDGRGVYWASRKQPEFIKSLKGQTGYSDDAIDRALVERVTAYTDQGSDRTDQARMNMYRYTQEGRIWFTRYFGLVKREELETWKKTYQTSQPITPGDGQPYEDDLDKSDTVEAIVIIAGGQVIKAEENPYKDQKRPARRCVYEDVEHEMWGVGIADNNEPHQKIINAAFRLYIEGKAFALMKMFSADRSKFSEREDFKLFPGKRFDMKPGLTPDERKEAIIWHDTEDVTSNWERVIEMSERFSDDDTAITKYTQGTDSSHLNDTATGISMIMNASSIPIKEVLGNVDEMWVEPMIEDLIDWNLENLEPETVKVLIGNKEAEIWSAIKQYGKANFMDWSATGSQTFMQKEVLMHKLQGYLQIVGQNERFAQYVDERELLEQVWDAGQIGKESPVYDEETVKKNAQNPVNQEAMQHIQQIQQEAEKLIKVAQERASKAEQDAQQAKQMEQYKMAELSQKGQQADRDHHLALFDKLHQFQQGTAQLHLTEAMTDKTQADAVQSLVKAGVEASQPLLEEAQNAESRESTGDTNSSIESSNGMAAT